MKGYIPCLNNKHWHNQNLEKNTDGSILKEDEFPQTVKVFLLTKTEEDISTESEDNDSIMKKGKRMEYKIGNPINIIHMLLITTETILLLCIIAGILYQWELTDCNQKQVHRINQQGHRINQQVHRINQQVHRINQQVHRINQQGHRINQQGHRINQQGHRMSNITQLKSNQKDDYEDAANFNNERSSRQPPPPLMLNRLSPAEKFVKFYPAEEYLENNNSEKGIIWYGSPGSSQGKFVFVNGSHVVFNRTGFYRLSMRFEFENPVTVIIDLYIIKEGKKSLFASQKRIISPPNYTTEVKLGLPGQNKGDAISIMIVPTNYLSRNRKSSYIQIERM